MPYPRDEEPQAGLWTLHVHGDYERAHVAALQALKLNTASGNNYVNLAYSYQWIGQIDQAKTTTQKSRAHNLDSPWLPLVLYNVNFLAHDAAAMEQEVTNLTYDLSSRAKRGIWVFACWSDTDRTGKNPDPSLRSG